MNMNNRHTSEHVFQIGKIIMSEPWMSSINKIDGEMRWSPVPILTIRVGLLLVAMGVRLLSLVRMVSVINMASPEKNDEGGEGD